jgi:hypothetical protein
MKCDDNQSVILYENQQTWSVSSEMPFNVFNLFKIIVRVVFIIFRQSERNRLCGRSIQNLLKTEYQRVWKEIFSGVIDWILLDQNTVKLWISVNTKIGQRVSKISL